MYCTHIRSCVLLSYLLVTHVVWLYCTCCVCPRISSFFFAILILIQNKMTEFSNENRNVCEVTVLWLIIFLPLVVFRGFRSVRNYCFIKIFRVCRHDFFLCIGFNNTSLYYGFFSSFLNTFILLSFFFIFL